MIEFESKYLSLPFIKDLKQLSETIWFNGNVKSSKLGLKNVGLTLKDVEDAEARLKRFAPFFAIAFQETTAMKGIIESEIVSAPKMQEELEKTSKIIGNLWIKKDSHLPISGSIKARGGIYAVLSHAEELLLQAGLISIEDDYSILVSEKIKKFFSKYKIAVGSTGNLGLSIGIIGAKLGFHVTVHMSSDAMEWKKNKLRDNGVKVIEYEKDYGVAVEQGRIASKNDPRSFFIDDENSKTLFLGYSVAGLRLRNQLEQHNICIDKDHPLFVYLPCGVGGAPGGVAFGLKLVFGDNVHCFFAEPTHSPCMLLGMATGLHDKISVQDIGIDNKTAADGLAVGRPSGFVGRAMEQLIDGCYTLSDDSMYILLAKLDQTEGIQVEPSAVAGMFGPIHITENQAYREHHNITDTMLKNSTHLVWATGGSMVPKAEIRKYLQIGRGLK